MKIIVLKGSPNKSGSSAMLASSFIKGAAEAGNEVVEFDVAHMNIKPCRGCVACGYEGPCVQHDDMERIRAEILSADMIVFVTPLYYYGMSAQLKAVVDRFCSFNSSISARRMKSALITAAWNSDDWTFEALAAHYRTLVRYLNFSDQGMILGYGCGTVSMTQKSRSMEDAYELGRRVSK